MALLSTICCAIAITGCGQQQKYANSNAAGYTDYAAPKLNEALPASVQAGGIRLVQQFVGDLNRKDYAAASRMLAPKLQAQWTPDRIAWQMTKGGYWMLAGSTNWRYDQVQGLKHGNEMVVHAQFDGTDHNLYKTNVSFTKAGESWLIDMIVNPIPRLKTQLVPISGSAPSAPGHK